MLPAARLGSTRRALGLWALVLLGPMAASPALAQAQGRSQDPAALIAEGKRHWKMADYARAFAAFDRAYRASGSLGAGLDSARALVRLGRLVEAARRYEEVVAGDPRGRRGLGPPSVQQEALVELQQLWARIPRIVVTIDGAPQESVQVSLNGQAMGTPPAAGVPVNPGQHRVVGRFSGQVVETVITVTEGEVQTAALRFAPDPNGEAGAWLLGAAEPGVPGERGIGLHRIAAYSTLGIGAAALITGGLVGLSALEDQAELAERCPGARCPSELEPVVDAYEGKKTIALIGLAAGTAFLGTSLVLHLTAPERPRRAVPRVGAGLGLGTAYVWGSF